MKTYPFFILTIIFLINSSPSFSQEDIQIGTNLKNFRQQSQGGYFDYSDPEGINIKVLVWGFVKFPGQYIIPANSSVNDLIALAGGPSEDALLEDLRLFRVKEDSSQEMIKFNYDDLLWNDRLSSEVIIPDLKAGDILLVPGEPRFYFRDYFTIALSAVSTLVSVATLIVLIFK